MCVCTVLVTAASQLEHGRTKVNARHGRIICDSAHTSPCSPVSGEIIKLRSVLTCPCGQVVPWKQQKNCICLQCGGL